MAVKSQTKKTVRGERNGLPAPNLMQDNVRAYKREIILNAAIDVFFEKGYQNSSVDDISAAMSVTKAVVYYNFNSKEEVLENIVDRTLTLTHRSIDRGIEGGKNPAQQLALLCYFYTAHILENQKRIAVYFREERSFSPGLRRRASILEKSIDEKVSAVLDAGVIGRDFKAMDSRLMAITIMGMISMSFHWYRPEGRISAENLCRHFSEQALKLAGFSGTLGLDLSAYKFSPDAR